MRFGIALLMLALLAGTFPLEAQTRKRAPAKPSAKAPAKSPATKSGPVDMKCPALLGTGVKTQRVFCDVLSGIDPKEGILMTLGVPASDAARGIKLLALLKQNIRINW